MFIPPLCLGGTPWALQQQVSQWDMPGMAFVLWAMRGSTLLAAHHALEFGAHIGHASGDDEAPRAAWHVAVEYAHYAHGACTLGGGAPGRRVGAAAARIEDKAIDM